MMTLEDYAIDVNLSVEEIKELCDRVGISYEDENSLLDELKMNCRDLYQEYLKSDEYIQKTKKLKDEEVTKFVNYARHFIEFFE